MRRVVVFVALLLALVVASGHSVYAQAPTLADQLRDLIRQAEAGSAAAATSNPEQMRAEYQAIDARWEVFEDQIREKDAGGYVELEGALAALKVAVQAPSPDPAAVRAAYAHLAQEADEVADRLGGTATAPAPAAEATPSDLLKLLDSTYTQIAQGNPTGATAQLDNAIRIWPSIEGAIATTSQAAYTTIEVSFGQASTALKAQPADLSAAALAVARARDALTPFATTQAYTALDAAAIILREGLEALLVIVALLAFLRRSGNNDKRGWIWLGGALGVLASIITAVLLQALFTRVSAGQNREVIEGVTGLVAAALLFYVAYWLHSKANLHIWQRYINTRTSQALARGSMVGLALLAFLAVFREGAETTVFYLGMAPSIALRDLLLGLGLGVGMLSVAAVLMLIVGVRLPLRPFFQIAGLLVYYLGFKFVGTGIHALQVAGVLPSSGIPALPTVPFFGSYPTWETTLPQLALLLGALLAFLYLRARDRRLQTATTKLTA